MNPARPDAYKCLPAAREALFSENHDAAKALLGANFRYPEGVSGWDDKNQFGCYQALGDLTLKFKFDGEGGCDHFTQWPRLREPPRSHEVSKRVGASQLICQNLRILMSLHRLPTRHWLVGFCNSESGQCEFQQQSRCPWIQTGGRGPSSHAANLAARNVAKNA